MAHEVASDWKTMLRSSGPEGSGARDKVFKQMENAIAFWESSRKYNELCELYWPGSQLDQSEKVQRTANKVGLSTVPRAL